MNWELMLSISALLISSLAAFYVRRSATEANRANNIGRLNALLALRVHYLELMQRQVDLVKVLGHLPSGLKAINDTYAELDTRLREVSREIDKQHAYIIGLYT